MSNIAFTKVSEVAAPISDLTVSNNLRIGGTTKSGSVIKTLVIPVATAAPSDAPNNLIQITPEQSGTTFLLDQSATGTFHKVLILPPASVGLNYTFICRTTSSATISIMPYGYTVAGGNPAGGANGVAEAYADSIQIHDTIGKAALGYTLSDTNSSEQVNTVIGTGTGVVGGVMFTASMGAAAMFKLTCVSTSITGAINSNAIRWIGVGQNATAQDISVSA